MQMWLKLRRAFIKYYLHISPPSSNYHLALWTRLLLCCCLSS